MKINNIIKYIIVGGICYISDILIFWICVKLLLMHWFFASTISFSMISLVGFYLYLNIVFYINPRSNRRIQLLLFLVSNLVSMLIHQFVLYLGVEVFKYDIIYTKIVTSTLMIFINYFVRSMYIFK
jgi:putative flippase GtrA